MCACVVIPAAGPCSGPDGPPAARSASQPAERGGEETRGEESHLQPLLKAEREAPPSSAARAHSRVRRIHGTSQQQNKSSPSRLIVNCLGASRRQSRCRRHLCDRAVAVVTRKDEGHLVRWSLKGEHEPKMMLFSWSMIDIWQTRNSAPLARSQRCDVIKYCLKPLNEWESDFVLYAFYARMSFIVVVVNHEKAPVYLDHCLGRLQVAQFIST